MLRKSKLALSVMLALSLTFGTMLSFASAAAPQDAAKHWAADTIGKWMDAGWIKGYPDGSFKPDAPIKRGELATLINRAFHLSDAGTGVSFSDLPSTNWAYQDMAIAAAAGYIHGTGDGRVSPNNNTTRQEAAVMIASVLKLDTQNAADLSSFKDSLKVASWAKGAVAALTAKNVFKGDNQGDFRPNAPITRAEALVALDAALSLTGPTVYDKPGVFGSVYGTDTINGDVMIASDGVTLQNTVITGNLTIAKEVGDGDVTLHGVTVKGTTTVNGGGENSVHLEDSVLLRVIVDKPSGKVRIVAIGSTKVQDVIVNSSAKIEESHVTDSGFTNIELASALPKGSSVDLIGQYEDVRVLSANIQLNIPSGSVQNLSVAEGAADNTINVSKEAQVLQLVLDAVSKLIGQGKVENATVNDQAKGSSFETKPVQVRGSGKDTIVTAPSTPVAVGGGSGGSSSGGGAGNSGNSGNAGGGSGGNDQGSGNGGGGSDNDGGDNGNVPPVCTADCDNASLSALSVSSSVYQFQLVQRDSGNQIIGTGFDSESFKYTVEVPENYSNSDATISVAAATYASVIYYIQYDNSAYEENILNKDQQSFTIHLKPHRDVAVHIYVSSGNGIGFKNYEIFFYYDRSLQEAFRLSNLASDPSSTDFVLESYALEAGDQVTVTVPAADTSGETDLVLQDEYDGAYGVSFYLSYPYITNYFTPHQLQGTMHVVVKRDGEEIMNGDYHYDLTPVNILDDDGSGIQVDLWTKQQLQDYDAQSDDEDTLSYGLSVSLDISKASSLPQSAVSLDVTSTDRLRTDTVPRNWTKEDLKTSCSLFRDVYAHNPIKEDGSTIWGVLAYYSPLYDQYLYIFLYDENNQPLGYYVKEVNFDADHVGDGVTVIPPVDPSNIGG